MNRDTLYSSAIIDISRGATLTVPAFGDRYLSVMVVNQDHYINEIWREPGTYRLSLDQFDTPYVAVALLSLASAGINSTRAFGSKESVDPVRHLLATAAGWGGLPETEALYIGVEPNFRSGNTSWSCHPFRSTASGRSRSTTPTASSRSTTATPTTSTTSLAPKTPTAR